MQKKNAEIVEMLKDHAAQGMRVIEQNTAAFNSTVVAQNTMTQAINTLKDNVMEAIVAAASARRNDREDEKKRPTGR